MICVSVSSRYRSISSVTTGQGKLESKGHKGTKAGPRGESKIQEWRICNMDEIITLFTGQTGQQSVLYRLYPILLRHFTEREKELIVPFHIFAAALHLSNNIFAEMDSHRDSIDSVFSSKLESAGSSWNSNDALLESGGASDRGFFISKLRSCPVFSRPFLMGWIFATAIHICIVLFALMFVNFVRLEPEDWECSAKVSTYCESTQSSDTS